MYRYLCRIYNIENSILIFEISFNNLKAAKKYCEKMRYTKYLILDILSNYGDGISSKIMYVRGFD